MDDGVAYEKIVGVSFYQEALAHVQPGQPVRLVHEPDNPHDEMALRVETEDGSTLGYIPKRSWVRGAVHEHGRGISAVIASVGYGRACLLGARISAALSDDTVRYASYYGDAVLPEPPRGGFRYWVSSAAAAEQLMRSRQGLGSPTRSPRPQYRRHSASAE